MTKVLTTMEVEPHRRADYWRHALSDVFVPIAITEKDKDRFGGTLSFDWIGRLMVARVHATSQNIQRTPRLISKEDDQYFQIILAADGETRLSQDDRAALLKPGDVAVYETTRPFEFSFPDDWEVWVFTFLSDSVPLSEGQRRLLTAKTLDSRAPMTGVMSRFLMDVARHSDQLSGEQSERVLMHATDLVVTLLSHEISDSETVRTSGQRALVLAVKDYIQTHLGDHDLAPATIAAATNISVRYLHKLFECEPESVATYVRRLRLERCRRDLLDPRMDHLSIAAIAFRWGFGDLSTFNRAFKAAFGITPREMRGDRLTGITRQDVATRATHAGKVPSLVS